MMLERFGCIYLFFSVCASSRCHNTRRPWEIKEPKQSMPKWKQEPITFITMCGSRIDKRDRRVGSERVILWFWRQFEPDFLFHFLFLGVFSLADD